MNTKVEIKTEQYYYVTDQNGHKYRNKISESIWYEMQYDFWEYYGESDTLDEIVQNSGVINHTITGTQEI